MTEYNHKDENPRNLEPYFSRHLDAMTGENLVEKDEIAKELAYRDQKYDELMARFQNYQNEYAEALSTMHEILDGGDPNKALQFTQRAMHKYVEHLQMQLVAIRLYSSRIYALTDRRNFILPKDREAMLDMAKPHNHAAPHPEIVHGARLYKDMNIPVTFSVTPQVMSKIQDDPIGFIKTHLQENVLKDKDPVFANRILDSFIDSQAHLNPILKDPLKENLRDLYQLPST